MLWPTVHVITSGMIVSGAVSRPALASGAVASGVLVAAVAVSDVNNIAGTVSKINEILLVMKNAGLMVLG